MRTSLPLPLALLLLVDASPGAGGSSDPRAVAIAEAVFERLGGRDAWDATRSVRWDFFGSRTHHWQKPTGDLRLRIPEQQNEAGESERPELLIWMNLHTRDGRVWEAGEEVRDPARLREHLDRAHEIWINDSYWMFMPYKLLDPGVRLDYAGERPLPDGRAADVLDLTFDAGVGYTPENRYEVFVARDTGLVEQWSFFADAADAEPRFTLPWAGWRPFGKIWLATDHGRGKNWNIEVDAAIPASLAPE
jgi:hypothetical protein